MEVLLAVPILILLLIIQTAVLNQIPLLQGSADLILLALVAWSLQKNVRSAWIWAIIAGLMVSFVSALPLGVYLIGYLITVAIGFLIRQRVWSLPLLTMYLATFLSTLVLQGISIIALRLADTSLDLGLALNLIILPGLLLNMIFALPFYTLFSDLANFLHPESLEI